MTRLDAGNGTRHRETSRDGSERIVGVDVARGMAVLGMLIAHAVPRTDDTELLVDGRSAVLFASLAGVSLGLLSGGAVRPGSIGRANARRVVLIRALVILPLGLILWTLGSGIAVILDYYAVMFMLLIPLLFASRLVLAGIGVSLLVAGPILVAWGERLEQAGTPLRGFDWFITGYFPASAWLPLLLAGLICARSDLRRRRTQLAVLVSGLAAMAAGYGAAALLPGVSAAAHSSSHAELIGSGGFAFALLGLALIAAPDAGSRRGGVLRAVLWPVAAVGAMPLTVYTGQILVLAIIAAGPAGRHYADWPLLAGLIIGSLSLATVWRLRFGAGPLERLLRAVSDPSANRRHDQGSAG